MLKRSIIQSISFIFLLISTQCLYEPDGENVVSVEEPDLSKVSIDLNALSNDTVYVDVVKVFKFNVSGLVHHPESFRAYINNKLYTAGNPGGNGYFEFELSPVTLGTGYHKLRIEYTARSGTNSLADNVGLEKVTVQKEWVIDADATKPAPIALTVDTLNGTVTLNWQPYKHRTFKKYIVSKICKDGSSYPPVCSKVEFTDPNQTTWTDNFYVGENAFYRVDVVASVWTVEGPPLDMRFDPHMDYSFISVKEVKLTWRKPFFHKNVNSITVRKFNAPIAQYTDISVTEHVTSNTFVFGYPAEEGLKIIMAGVNKSTTYAVNVAIGKPINVGFTPRFLSLKYLTYNPVRKKYYCQIYVDQEVWFASFDENLNLYKKGNFYTNNIGYSQDGNYMYCSVATTDAAIASQGNVSAIDHETLVPTKIFSLATKLNVSGMSILGISVSNNNVVGTQTFYGNYNFSLPSEQSILLRNNAFLQVAHLRISSDGKYIYDDGKLYAITNNIPTLIKTYTPNYSINAAVFFRPDVPNELVFILGSEITIENVQDFTTRTITLSGALNKIERLSYDPISGYLALSTEMEPYMHYMIHLTNGTFFPVQGSSSYVLLDVANNLVFAGNRYVDISYLKEMSTP